ncbi:MAG: type II toxin-antitoxin system HicA family toxin [Thermoplasmatota archaeon]
MARLPAEIDGRRFLRALARLGWTLETQRGSHRKLRHPAQPRFLVVAFHTTVSRASVRAALRDAGITDDEFLRVL